MRILLSRSIPAGLASLSLCAFAGSAQAGQVDVFFAGTIDDPASSGLEAGDEVQGTFSYNSATPDTGFGSYENTVTNLDLFLIDVSEGGGFSTFVNQPDGDLFVGTDSIELYYGPDAGQLGDNFGLNFYGSSAAFNNSLADATDELVDAGGGAAGLFGGGIDGFIQNDDTFEELYFIVDYIEFTAATTFPVGDVDFDGDVDIDDLGILAGNWQQSISGVANGDIDEDGDVDIDDLGLLAGNWQAGVPASSLADFDEAAASAGIAIPEPGSLAVLGLGGLALLRRRR